MTTNSMNAMNAMRAVQLRRFGDPTVLEVVTVPRPVPGPGEVLVRVDASAVNVHDTLVRDGTLKLMTGRTFPMGVGLDFAGEIVQIGDPAPGPDPGPDPGLAVGSAVWGMVSPRGAHVTGAAAEYVVVSTQRVAPYPSTLSAVEAASLVTSGTTALRAVRDETATRSGARVLVRGAAGGVGIIAVQLAHALGAHVTALAGPHDHDLVTANGAEQVLDYHTTTPSDTGPFDVIIDTVGRQLPAYRRRLTPHGRMVTINFGSAPALAAIAASRVFGARRIRTFSGHPDRHLLTDLAQHVRSGAVHPVIGQVYPLDHITQAHHDLTRRRHPGKLVLTTATPPSTAAP